MKKKKINECFEEKEGAVGLSVFGHHFFFFFFFFFFAFFALEKFGNENFAHIL